VGNDTALRTDRLRALRERKGWSQRELARLCGLREIQINRYESGVNDPSATFLKMIAEKLGVSMDYLVGLSDDPQGPISSELTEDERAIVTALRRDSWPGVIRIAADHIAR